jgi:hypothetical protein
MWDGVTRGGKFWTDNFSSSSFIQVVVVWTSCSSFCSLEIRWCLAGRPVPLNSSSGPVFAKFLLQLADEDARLLVPLGALQMSTLVELP